MNANTITNGFNYLMAFVSAAVAGLIGFDWLTFFDAPTALKIVGGLNFLGIMTKAWIATAEQMAKSMTAANATAASTTPAGDA